MTINRQKLRASPGARSSRAASFFTSPRFRRFVVFLCSSYWYVRPLRFYIFGLREKHWKNTRRRETNHFCPAAAIPIQSARATRAARQSSVVMTSLVMNAVVNTAVRAPAPSRQTARKTTAGVVVVGGGCANQTMARKIRLGGVMAALSHPNASHPSSSSTHHQKRRQGVVVASAGGQQVRSAGAPAPAADPVPDAFRYAYAAQRGSMAGTAAGRAAGGGGGGGGGGGVVNAASTESSEKKQEGEKQQATKSSSVGGGVDGDKKLRVAYQGTRATSIIRPVRVVFPVFHNSLIRSTRRGYKTMHDGCTARAVFSRTEVPKDKSDGGER